MEVKSVDKMPAANTLLAIVGLTVAYSTVLILLA